MNGASADTLGTLAATVAPLLPEAPTLKAYEAFSADPTLYAIAVVDGHGLPVGLLNRFKFLEAPSRPFGRDLFQHQTVASAMDASPLVVDEHVPLDQLSSILVDDTSGSRCSRPMPRARPGCFARPTPPDTTPSSSATRGTTCAIYAPAIGATQARDGTRVEWRRGDPVSADAIDDAIELMRLEYAEMPDMALTFWQAQRLWNLSPDVCRQALDSLLSAAYLAKTRDGTYVRVAGA